MLPDEWEELPEDNDEAFAKVITLAQPRLRERLRMEQEWAERSEDYSGIRDAQHGFMSSLVGVAKSYSITAFADRGIPHPSDWDNHANSQFQSDLNHFLAQVTARKAIRLRQASVAMDNKSKDRLRSYLHGLKIEIDKSSMSEARKAVLLDRLAAFEKELDGRRINILTVSLIVMEILGVPGSVWASHEVVKRLSGSAIECVGQAKIAENEVMASRLPTPTLQITSAAREAKIKAAHSLGNYEINDDIPF